ncbi:CotH kinase family protein [Mucilaginibacter ximonensis]|uniref:CotH kinase family protein n=1 Tax=Mucilaginibacter ximonensis TaxID=538021 RepID=A0ABW5YB14_9SPHI
MKPSYLIYLSVFTVLVFAGCKKNDSNQNSGKTTVNNGNGKSTPTLPQGAAQLLNFKINGASCAFDSLSVSYYYPVAVGTSLTGYTVNYDTTATAAVYINNVQIKNGGVMNSSITANDELTIRAVNALNETSTYHLVITGMPIVTLTCNSEIADDDVNAKFDLVNPDYQAEHSQLEITSNIQIAIRGGVSRDYPKKNYKVHTVDASNNDIDVSLLGLRHDNSWILDAMYIDQARMRNRVCTDLWNTFNNVPYLDKEPTALNGTRGYMTEVFLNGKYHGIYCLTEKLDRKQLQIKKQYGDMYKADFWTSETAFQGISAYDNTAATWGGWELEYPELGDSPAPDWGYLYNEVNFIANSTDADFATQIASRVDINNIVDYFIFINVLNAPDNENKNTFFSFYDIRSAGYFFYSPWDLDGTIGRNAGGGMLANQIIGPANNNLFARLMNLNAANFNGLVKARWAQLKDNQLSKAAVASRIEVYRKLLNGTNAFARERQVWDNITQDLNVEAAYMTNWYSTQYDQFDNYVKSL